MVLTAVTRRCPLGRSTATRVILVGAVILWTVMFNMVTFRQPEAASSTADSAPRSGWSEAQAEVQSSVSLPEVQTIAVQKSASLPEVVTVVVQGSTPPPEAQAAVVLGSIPPSVVQSSVPSSLVESSIPPLAVEATGEPRSVHPPTEGTAEVQETAPAVGTAGIQRNVMPPAGESVVVQKGASQPTVKGAFLPTVKSASLPTVKGASLPTLKGASLATVKAAEVQKSAGPPPGSHNSLSCFTNGSTPEQRHFSEDEKAMFRYLFDWPEVPTSSCKRMFKMGGMAGGEGCLVDGDKHVCLDEPLSLAAARDDCLVYSFGINKDWSFDEAAEAFGCEVHSFDPSIDYPEGKRSPGITFHHFGVGRQKHVNIYGWQLYTLDEIINLLGHQGRTIHYLKMDAEGGEFHMMAQQLLDGEGEFVLDKVEQIGFEVHFKLDPHLQMGFYRRANRSVHAMRELGFNLVHWEYNKVVMERYMFPGVERPTSLLYEILLVKNGPDTWDRSQRGRRQREVVAALAARAMTLFHKVAGGGGDGGGGGGGRRSAGGGGGRDVTEQWSGRDRAAVGT